MEEDIKVLNELGAKVLLQLTKSFVDTKTELISNTIEQLENIINNNSKSILNITSQLETLRGNVGNINDDLIDIRDNTKYIRFDRSDNLFRIGYITATDTKVSFFRVNYDLNNSTINNYKNSVSINYPYRFKSSSNTEKSATAIYINKDIKFRSIPDNNNVKTIAKFNTDKIYLKSHFIHFHALSDKDTKFKLENGYFHFNTRIQFSVKVKENNISSCYSSLKIENSSTFGYVHYKKCYESYNINTKRNIKAGFKFSYREKNSFIKVTDISGRSMLQSNIITNHPDYVQDGLFIIKDNLTYLGYYLKNTLYYPKCIYASIIPNDYNFFKIENVGENRLAINCITKPKSFDDTGNIIKKAETILELNGNLINIGKNIKGNHLNVNYKSIFNNKTTFNDTAYFGNNVYLDGFESDATLSTILSSEYGLYFSSSDNGYKCNLLNLIKAILVKLIS